MQAIGLYLFTIAIGVGPRTATDGAYHIFIIIPVLASGLIVAFRVNAI